MTAREIRKDHFEYSGEMQKRRQDSCLDSSQKIWCRTYTNEAPPHTPDTSDVSFTDHGFQPISVKRKVNTKASIDCLQENAEGWSECLRFFMPCAVKYKDTLGSIKRGADTKLRAILAILGLSV